MEDGELPDAPMTNGNQRVNSDDAYRFGPRMEIVNGKVEIVHDMGDHDDSFIDANSTNYTNNLSSSNGKHQHKNSFDTFPKPMNDALPRFSPQDFRASLLSGAGNVSFCYDVETAVAEATAWMSDTDKMIQMRELKMMTLGNARVIYGNDRNRFYDIITSYTLISGQIQYSSILVVTIDGSTKALRKETASDPLVATRNMVQGLMTDAGSIFARIPTGQRFHGQQGITSEDGTFQVFEGSMAERKGGGKGDDTRDMERKKAVPRGPAGWCNHNGDTYRPAKRKDVGLDYDG
ncbi:hypothetical protein M011DRAFT_486501 [Sporormia fimetaria CBS 119925]|uniref:Uncharacterized protein n=1 Tax=Sporormia fimetaria CBS 119925 TaxID=1340428 RepID=A0A6A6VES3_9PLEO|nr:hypothetical protein M011DRAFT_486501 [Sporormia fimetaria CBS 119925]